MPLYPRYLTSVGGSKPAFVGPLTGFFLVQLADYVDRIDRVVEILANQ